jgi:hypothetical protein
MMSGARRVSGTPRRMAVMIDGELSESISLTFLVDFLLVDFSLSISSVLITCFTVVVIKREK